MWVFIMYVLHRDEACVYAIHFQYDISESIVIHIDESVPYHS